MHRSEICPISSSGTSLGRYTSPSLWWRLCTCLPTLRMSQPWVLKSYWTPMPWLWWDHTHKHTQPPLLSRLYHSLCNSVLWASSLAKHDILMHHFKITSVCQAFHRSVGINWVSGLCLSLRRLGRSYWEWCHGSCLSPWHCPHSEGSTALSSLHPGRFTHMSFILSLFLTSSSCQL